MRFIGMIWLTGLSLLLSNCSYFEDDSGDRRVALIEKPLKFQLNPNDPQTGDSVVSALSKGFLVPLRQGGEYQFQFESEPGQEFELNAVRVINNYLGKEAFVYEVSESPEGVYTAQFDWEYSDYFSVLRVAALGGDRTGIPMTNPHIEGLGTKGDTLKILLHIFGEVEGMATEAAAKVFTEALGEQVMNILDGSGIYVGDVKYLRGSQHPLFGDLVTDSTQVEGSFGSSGEMILSWAHNGLQSINLDDVSTGMDSEYPGYLDVVIVNSFRNKNPLIGVSPFYGGGFQSGEATAVILARNSVEEMGGSIFNSADVLAETFVHEMSHFLGLRHTTAALGESSDYSIRDDGLSDTPYSPLCKPEAAMLNQNENTISNSKLIMARGIAALDDVAVLEQCPDQSNLMFPLSIQIEQTDFTPMQRDLVMKNLNLMPR